MTRYWKSTLGLVFALNSLLAATGGAHAIFIKGAVGPAGEVCKNAGGSMNGKMCTFEDGRSCEGTTLALHNKCVDEDGNVIDEGPDYGSNLPPDESDEDSGGE